METKEIANPEKWPALQRGEEWEKLSDDQKKIEELEERIKALEAHCHESNGDQTSAPVFYKK